MNRSSHITPPCLQAFLAGQDEATKAKYATELENASDEWQPAIDFRYAESLVHFGLLERNVETLYTSSGRLRGSMCRFKKTSECTPTVNISAQTQTSLEFA